MLVAGHCMRACCELARFGRGVFGRIVGEEGAAAQRADHFSRGA